MKKAGTYFWRAIKSFFFHDNGKLSWTAVTSAYGIHMTHRIVNFVQSTIEAGGDLPVEYLQWTVPIATALIAGRPVQMGLAAIRKPAADGLDKKTDPLLDDEPATTGEPSARSFALHEFHCKDGTPVPKKLYGNLQRHMSDLQVLRDYLNNKYGATRGEVRLNISSGYRTKKHNAAIGGSSESRHMEADASDMFSLQVSAKEIYDAANELMQQGNITPGGLAIYERNSNHVHLDSRGVSVRW